MSRHCSVVFGSILSRAQISPNTNGNLSSSEPQDLARHYVAGAMLRDEGRKVYRLVNKGLNNRPVYGRFAFVLGPAGGNPPALPLMRGWLEQSCLSSMAPRKGKKGRRANDSDEDEAKAPAVEPMAEAAPGKSVSGGRQAKKRAGRRGRAVNRGSGSDSDEPGLAAAVRPPPARSAGRGAVSFAALQSDGDDNEGKEEKEEEEEEEEEPPAAAAVFGAFGALDVRRALPTGASLLLAE